jgi:hypothetical protein
MITPRMGIDSPQQRGSQTGDMIIVIRDSQSERRTAEEERDLTAEIDYRNGISQKPEFLNEKEKEKNKKIPQSEQNQINRLRTPEQFYVQLMVIRKKIGRDIPIKIGQTFTNYRHGKDLVRYDIYVSIKHHMIHWPGGHYPEQLEEQRKLFADMIERVNAEANSENLTAQ